MKKFFKECGKLIFNVDTEVLVLLAFNERF